MPRRWKRQGICEVEIEGNEGTPFCGTRGRELTVRGSGHPLKEDGGYVMALVREALLSANPNVLGQLQLQEAAPDGIST